MPNKKPELNKADIQEFLLVSTDGTAVTPTIQSSPATTPQPPSPKGTPTLKGLFDDILDSSSSSTSKSDLAITTEKQPSLPRTASPQQASAAQAQARIPSPEQLKINLIKPTNPHAPLSTTTPSTTTTFPPAVVRSPINPAHTSSLSSSVFNEDQMNRMFVPEPQRRTKKSFSEHVSETLDDIKDLFAGIGRSFKNCFGSCFGCCADSEPSVNYRYGNTDNVELFMYAGRVNPINIDDPNIHAPSSPSVSSNQTPYVRIPEFTGVRRRLGQ